MLCSIANKVSLLSSGEGGIAGIRFPRIPEDEIFFVVFESLGIPNRKSWNEL